MRIAVFAKQVPDLAQVRMDRDTRGPVLKDVPFVLGELEKNALEEASRLKEAHGAEVTAISAGWPAPESAMLECLARGADSGLTVVDPALDGISSTALARVLARSLTAAGGFDLALFGEGSTDDNQGQMGAMVAQLLDLPLASHARQIDISGQRARIVCGFDDGTEVWESSFPVIVTVASELNIPRIPTIIEAMEASSKPQRAVSLADLGLTFDQLEACGKAVTASNTYPRRERKNRFLEGDLATAAADLVKSLAAEGAL